MYIPIGSVVTQVYIQFISDWTCIISLLLRYCILYRYIEHFEVLGIMQINIHVIVRSKSYILSLNYCIILYYIISRYFQEVFN